MNNHVFARIMVRAFGLFLLTQSAASLPRVILQLVTGNYSSFVEIFFSAALPFFIPPIVGLLMLWNPDGMLRMSRDVVEHDEPNAGLNIEVVAISLLGLYWLVLGMIDTVYQLSWGVMTKESAGRFFNTYDALADTISAVFKLVVGAAIAYYSGAIQAKLAALRKRKRGESGRESETPPSLIR